MQTVKILTLWVFVGIAFGGLIAAIVTKYDGYCDWLLVKQTILLGALGGFLMGGTYHYMKSYGITKETVMARIAQNKAADNPRKAEQLNAEPLKTAATAVKPKSFWSFLWRGGLTGLIGLVVGIAAGIALCVSQYEGLSADAKAWIIFYVPFFALYVFIAAVLGMLSGSVLGVVWNYLRR